MVSVRGDPRPTYTSADFLGATYGGAAQSMCCSEIRRRNPGWTGDVYIGIIGSAPSILDIRLWSKPELILPWEFHFAILHLLPTTNFLSNVSFYADDTKLPIDRFWFQRKRV